MNRSCIICNKIILTLQWLVMLVFCRVVLVFWEVSKPNTIVKYVVAVTTIWKSIKLQLHWIYLYKCSWNSLTLNNVAQSNENRLHAAIGRRCCNCWDKWPNYRKKNKMILKLILFEFRKKFHRNSHTDETLSASLQLFIISCTIFDVVFP